MLEKACKVLYIQYRIFFLLNYALEKKNTPSKHSICNVVNLSGKHMQIANKDQDKKKISNNKCIKHENRSRALESEWSQLLKKDKRGH